jgi:hypothetical protein
MAVTLILGALVGLAFGYVSQRGRFCMLTAYYEIIKKRSPDVLRAYLLAVFVQMIAVNLFIEYENLDVNYLQFFGVVTALGGFLLGLGMVLATGCAGAIFYRAGEGKLDYIFATLAFGVSAWASNNWFVDAARRLFGGDGIALVLPRALGMDRWVMVALIAIAAVLYILGARRQLMNADWNWSITGLALGLVGVFAWLTSSLAGHPTGLGTAQGSINLASLLFEQDPNALNWNLLMVAGIPVGSFIASRRNGITQRHKTFTWQHVPQSILGGALMGVGATIAFGDNILHGLSGLPILGLSSIVVMLCVFAGVWVGIRLGWLN